MPDPVVHFEVAGPNAAGPADFYRAIFGWSIEPGPFPDYFNISTDGPAGLHGGIRQEDAPERVFYVRVASLEATLARVVSLGGRVLIPPTVVPGVVPFALFEDPSGNKTGLVH